MGVNNRRFKEVKVGDSFPLNSGVIVTVSRIISCSDITVVDNKGNSKSVRYSCLKMGLVSWKEFGVNRISTKKIDITKHLGEKFILNCGVEVTVVSYMGYTKITVEDDKGNRKIVSLNALQKGLIKWSDFDGYSWDYLGVAKAGYYIYTVECDGEIVYVGKGTGRRYLHARSGTSHNLELNRLYFMQTPTIVSIYKSGLTENESLIIEKELISSINPKFNISLK